jgi:hypothetical protein
MADRGQMGNQVREQHRKQQCSDCPQEERVDKMFTDLYLGDGKDNPSVTTRLTLLEDAMERFSRNSNKLVFIGVTTLVGVAASLVMRAFGK